MHLLFQRLITIKSLAQLPATFQNPPHLPQHPLPCSTGSAKLPYLLHQLKDAHTICLPHVNLSRGFCSRHQCGCYPDVRRGYPQLLSPTKRQLFDCCNGAGPYAAMVSFPAVVRAVNLAARRALNLQQARVLTFSSNAATCAKWVQFFARLSHASASVHADTCLVKPALLQLLQLLLPSAAAAGAGKRGKQLVWHLIREATASCHHVAQQRFLYPRLAGGT
jgi:hypothetical protein